MPSVFDDPNRAQFITATECPPFDQKTIECALEAQTKALGQRHVHQQERFDREAEQFALQNPDNWPALNTLKMKRLLLLSEQKGEAWELERRHAEGIERWKGNPQPVIPVTMNTFNVPPPPAYFRALVWNLENFTRDKRPRGSSPIDSLRNQARIAVVAEAMERYQADLLLIMETGRDVGPATSRIAQIMQEKEAQREEQRPWQPLVSPPTGEMPKIYSIYPAVKAGRPNFLKVLALKLLFDVYRVKPNYKEAVGKVTAEQIAEAWEILRAASPDAGEALPDLTLEQAAIVADSGNAFPNPELIVNLVHRAAEDLRYVANSLPELEEAIGLLMDVSLTLAERQLQYGPLGVAHAIDAAREIVGLLRDFSGDDPESELRRRFAIGWTQGLELVHLFALKALRGEIPTEGLEGAAFISEDAMDSPLPLAAFFCTGVQTMRFELYDRKRGALNGAVDADLVLEALQCLNVIKRSVETYGIVYREPFDSAMEWLMNFGVLSHGFTLSEDAARYSIVQAKLTGAGFEVQEVGNPLNWRSGLQITIPAAPGVFLPFVLYHTRFTGTAEIKQLDRDYTAEENTIIARCTSVAMMADAVLPGHETYGLPLIVGDFNIPHGFVSEEDEPAHWKAKEPWERRRTARRAFRADMTSRGFLRHSVGGNHYSGYPPTTLKAYASIARGESPDSQPYDGVYHPFDYAIGRANLRSGVIAATGLVNDMVLALPIQGFGAATQQGVTIDPDEDEDQAHDDDAVVDDDGDETDAPTVQVQMSILETFAIEIGRVYRGFLSNIWRKVEKLMGWTKKRISQGDNVRASRNRAKTSDELIPLLQQLVISHQSFAAEVIEPRVAWFVQAVRAGLTQAYQPDGEDPLDVRLRLYIKIQAVAGNYRIPTFEKLPEEVQTLKTLLAALETDMNVRWLIGYRAVVSDHLPTFIEFAIAQ